MDNIIHTIVIILGVTVRFDTVTTHGGTGFGFVIGDRSHCHSGFDSLAAARRAAPRIVRRAIRARTDARDSNARRMRDMMTIGGMGSA